MNTDKILNQAQKMAMKAKPGFLKIGDTLYTFEFDQAQWVYNVYEDGFLMIRFNTKTLSKARQMLKDWLAN